MSKSLIKILSLLILTFALAGCRSQKGGTSTSGVIPGEGVAIPANTALNSRYTMLTESWKPWSDVEVGMKVSLSSPAKLNAAGKAWMKRGEWISISVRMLGFEVATLWVDRDSVVAVDKFHKKYISEPTSRLLGDANVTLEDMQDLLMGRAFLAGSGTATVADRKKFDFEEAANGWYLLPRTQPEQFNYGFLASNTSNALRGAIVEVKGYGSVSARYDDIFESRTCGWFAQEVNVETTRGKKIAVKLQWDLNGSKFNTSVVKSCRIPDNCERISASSLTSLLKNF